MFDSTITVTINSVAKVLNRISSDGYTSEYLLREATGDFRLKIRHTSYKRKQNGVQVDRHSVELVETVYPVTLGEPSRTRKAYAVIEVDQGDTTTAAEKFSSGFMAFHNSGNLTKLINWES